MGGLKAVLGQSAFTEVPVLPEGFGGYLQAIQKVECFLFNYAFYSITLCAK